MSLINTQVQPFKTEAFVNRNGKGEFITVTEESLKGKWSVLIFMPAAFTFNCPTEIEDAADNYAAFQAAGAEVYIVTTTPTSRTRCGTKLPTLWARPSSLWSATQLTN